MSPSNLDPDPDKPNPTMDRKLGRALTKIMDKDQDKPVDPKSPKCEAQRYGQPCNKKALTRYSTGRKFIWLCPDHLIEYSNKRYHDTNREEYHGQDGL